jgi:flavin-dependent dehydrogenase
MYDAIVVGARCAGSPTAMLLARGGQRVLLVDRAAFPSDTLSSHYIHQPGVACLDRWGLLEPVMRAGSPPIRDYSLDVGPFALRGVPPAIDGIDAAYSLQRVALDQILVEAAADAGAEVRERFSVQGLVVEDGRVVGVRGRTAAGTTVTERARIVIGADGMNSVVARAVEAPEYDAVPALTCAFYSYWSGVPMDGVELYVRPGRVIVTAPTNDDRVVVIVFWPHAQLRALRADLEGSFHAALELAPGLAGRVRAGTRTARFRGTNRLPNFRRRPYGDGWALVGDAGYHKDPILALGITDAFRDAELLADALLAGAPLGAYARLRDESSAHGFATTLQFARLEPPPQDMQMLFGALRHDQEQTNRLFGTLAGTVDAAEFWDPANVARILSGPAAVA